MKSPDLDLKNMRVNYNLNGKELREALGRKPEDSLDDYRDNLCVPMVVRRDIGEELTDDEWSNLYDAIINDDGVYNELDNTLSYYLEKMDRDREKKKQEKEKTHRIDVMIESYDTLSLKVTEEDYNSIMESFHNNGKIPAALMDGIINKNTDTILDASNFASKYIDVTLDGTGDFYKDALGGIVPIDIEDKIVSSDTPDAARWSEIVTKRH